MMKSSSIESTPPPGHSQSANEPPSPPRQSDEAISAVPAATPVEKGRFVLDLHNRDEDSDNDNANDDNDKNSNNADNNKEEAQDDINTNNNNAPDSPKSFNSEELFEDIETGEQTNDADLELLLEGPLPLRRTTGGKLNNMELDSAEDDDPEESPHHRNRKRSKGLCGCCPNVVRRSTLCHLVGLGSVTNNRRDNNAIIPPVKVGNMIVINSDCYYGRGFGIMGPHWFGPIACTILLSIATAHFAPKAFHNIGPLSGITCLLFYITALVSLLIVSCSDPGVVKPDCGRGDTNNGYAGLPTSANVNAGVGWRYCDLCSVYQPPGAVHCPECNVCIEGYDHHCPWMGTCIGKKNLTSFMAFNLTWLFYFFYAIIWVTFMGSALAAGPVESSAD